MRNLCAILILGLLIPGLSGLGTATLAADAQRGEALFKDCRACHSIIDETETPVVRGGRTGPNLYGVIGRHAGSVPGFNYSRSMVAAGTSGLRWNEEGFVGYIRDATAFLRTYLDDPQARGKMAYQLRDVQMAQDVWAYLQTVTRPPAP
ncbi:Cytochrome c family protein [Roseovarius sp. EC-HK134]|jgi:cytochrome c|uniref:c-type cytochrome n=1 Tax=unclassified Roseovarius TaxID=2614913 RepID=UPI0001557588|nr:MULTISPECIES: c-type cytochrome [unclassified Roseovarius]AWZ22469.1 Cytochrome c2 [Roseovarius sp. AK1035]EDM32198.1 cytochrome c family protein [Roseovarius sp. TM1035]VVT33001.1 Cytochrome c family protein [Roseovarius sp. EC-HK134]VVT33068.1 Cytochrome c family protein [Roseovarius sp. EC-SD190]